MVRLREWIAAAGGVLAIAAVASTDTSAQQKVSKVPPPVVNKPGAVGNTSMDKGHLKGKMDPAPVETSSARVKGDLKEGAGRAPVSRGKDKGDIPQDKMGRASTKTSGGTVKSDIQKDRKGSASGQVSSASDKQGRADGKAKRPPKQNSNDKAGAAGRGEQKAN